ncbi:MAG: hypothetical protein R3Y19_05900, partial [Rikenellaceae bacterium]
VSVLVLLIHTTICYGQISREVVKREIFSDTLDVKRYKESETKSNELYDNVLNNKSKFVEWLGGLLISSDSSVDDPSQVPITEYSETYFAQFQGSTIANIYIVGANIFGQTDGDDLSWGERTLNKLHIQTKNKVIQKNLMFEVGDTINSYLFSINEQYLRAKDYLSTAFFLIEPNPLNTGDMDVYVFVRDNWSISAAGGLGGAPYLDVFDRNIAGTGNMLLLRYYGNGADQRIGGEVDYVVNNLWGTFADATLRLGAGATNNALEFEINKGFILPSDHLWGIHTGYNKKNVGLPILDTTMSIADENWGAYYGYSFELNNSRNVSLYGMVSFDYQAYGQTPVVTPKINPYYANRITAMMSLGVSRQEYFQGNLIYGYGRIEDIPYGFKVEFTAGWEQNYQLGLRWYAGATARYGNYTKMGYFDIGVRGGTYINFDGTLSQGVFDTYFNYFSPLFDLKSLYIRQFFYARYTRGFNRLYGERELLYYSNPGINGLSTPLDAMGTNRLTISGETVFFTPIFLYHFRFALFGWGDCGWLGDNVNIFDNQFSATAGVGVRVKNERLIFNNIELRLGFLIKASPNAHFNWLQLTNERTFSTTPYTPDRPEAIIFE